MDRLDSVSESPLSKFLLGFLHDDHSSSIPHENWLATRDEASIETCDSLSAHNMPCTFLHSVSHSFGACLVQVFEHLKGPDEEKSKASGPTTCKELTRLSVKCISISSEEVDLQEVQRQHKSRSEVLFSYSLVDFAKLPWRPNLTIDFRVFEGALNERSCWSCN